ncbi:MAG: hypothetical protein ABI220_01300 [Candidatus Saccharimonadales bacterium]
MTLEAAAIHDLSDSVQPPSYDCLNDGIDSWNLGVEQVENYNSSVDYVTSVGQIAIAGDDHDELTDELTVAMEEVELPRGELSDMLNNPAQVKIADLYIELFAPDFIKSHKPEGVGWVDWLANYSSDAQLMNFLQWQYSTLKQQTESDRVKGCVEQTASMFNHGLNKGKSSGWVSQSAQFDGASVYIGDVFRTDAKGIGGRYGEEGTEDIIISQGVGKTEAERESAVIENIKDTLPHELVHYVVAMNSLDDDADQEPMSAHWINEALAEHMALVIKDGWPLVISPDRRRDRLIGRGVYREERQLLETLLTRGKHQVSPKLAMRAFSGTPEEKSEFHTALDAAWGVEHALEKINDYLGEPDMIQDGAERSEIADAILKVSGRLRYAPADVFGAKPSTTVI